MPSADFSKAITDMTARLGPDARTHRGSPEVRTTAFRARAAGFTTPALDERGLLRSFARSSGQVGPHDRVLVHRTPVLLHASFRPHLAMTPFALG